MFKTNFFDQRFLSDSDHFRLLIGLAVVLLLLATHLSIWVGVVATALGLWKLLIIDRRFPQPPTGWLLSLAGGAMVFVWLLYGNLFGRDAGVSLALLMVGLKLIEARSVRELRFLGMAGFCLLFSSILFSQSLLTLLICLLGLWLLTAALYGLGFRSGGVGPAMPYRMAGKLLLQAVPLMVVGFLLFPRAEIARWALPRDAAKALTGFTDTLSPGSVSHLAKSHAVAFHAQFDGEPPQQRDLYWRGKVLWLYDGVTWHGDDAPDEMIAEGARATEAVVNYSVLLEPHNQRWLFALDLPMQTSHAGYLANDYTLLAAKQVQVPMSYEVISALQHSNLHTLGPSVRHKTLQIPADENLRSMALAKQWAADSADAHGVVRAALDFFREGFRYSLNPSPIRSFDQIDAFLFRTRTGFCEHYAGSFVFLMRAAGIPARVVMGYQGGDVDARTRLVTVRQSHAHAWAEVWVDGRGWMRVDPVTVLQGSQVDAGTPAPPPPTSQRQDAQAQLAEPVLTDRSKLERPAGTIMQKFSGLDYWWKRNVINYRERSQGNFLKALTGIRPQPLVLLSWLGAALLSICAVMIAWSAKSSRIKSDPILHAWRVLEGKCTKAGCPPIVGEGPLDYVERCAQAWPQYSPELLEIGHRYSAARYGNPSGSEDVAELRRMVRKLRL